MVSVGININEVIRAVLNSLFFFFIKRFGTHKKALKALKTLKAQKSTKQHGDTRAKTQKRK